MSFRWIVRREPAVPHACRESGAAIAQIPAAVIALLLLASAFLFAACTQPIVVAANPANAGEFAIVGEPVVTYGGEPIVSGGEIVASPLATPQADHTAAAQTIPAVQDVASADVGSTADSAAIPPSPTPATAEPAPPAASLDDLLAEPVSDPADSAPNIPVNVPTDSNTQGGLAGAAHVTAHVTSAHTATVGAALATLLAQNAIVPPAATIETENLTESAPESVTESAEALPVPPIVAPIEAPPVVPTPDGTARTLRVPILMYHYLSTPPPAADIYRKDLSVAPDLFAAHLDRMQAEGFTAISLPALTQALMQGTPLPEKPVVITFDDGYRDNYENAFPLLRDRGITATFFVLTDLFDEQRPEYMTWDMAREMLAAGMAIESHGRNHATLAGRDDDYLIWQALGSMETIAYELGVRPRYISYPAGEYDENTMRIFASAGYWGGATTVQGAQQNNAEPFEMTRIRVRGTTSADDLIRLLNTDW